jgi:hypothetical protein
MRERQESRQRAADAQFKQYVRQAAESDPNASSAPSDELTKLAGLHQRGVLSDEEFQKAKSRVVV